MEKRKSISKKLRFEIFKRDGFKCMYCGAKPPKIPLEIDHIVPVSKGGTNNDINLITSCFDCNRGKSNIELNIVLETTEEKHNKILIAQKQYSEFNKLINKERKLIEDQIIQIENIYSSVFTDWCFSNKFKISVKTFLTKLPFNEVIDSIEIACNRPRVNSSQALKYFCGICWTKIKENE